MITIAPDRTIIAQVIADYDRQGWHRTGTDVDRLSAFWLVNQIQKWNLEATLFPFAVDRIEPQQAYVQIGQRRVEGIPLFDATFTNAHGISGTLGPLGSDADIAIAQITPQSDAAIHEEFRQIRRSGLYKGFIIITDSGRPGLALINAPDFTTPFGPPTLQVSSHEAPWLLSAVGQEALLVAQGQRIPTDAFNVVTRLKGQNSALPPLVIMTPRSGWWHCASERGGGIACWLEILRHLCHRQPQRDVLFLASSGHELGHLGLKAWISAEPDLVQRAQVWLHLGANIGVAVEGHTHRLAASNRELEAMALAQLQEADAFPDVILPPNHLAKGEARQIQARGGCYVSLTGDFRNDRFHHPDDRYPSAVDIDQILRFGTALTHLTFVLANGFGE